MPLPCMVSYRQCSARSRSRGFIDGLRAREQRRGQPHEPDHTCAAQLILVSSSTQQRTQRQASAHVALVTLRMPRAKRPGSSGRPATFSFMKACTCCSRLALTCVRSCRPRSLMLSFENLYETSVCSDSSVRGQLS